MECGHSKVGGRVGSFAFTGHGHYPFVYYSDAPYFDVFELRPRRVTQTSVHLVGTEFFRVHSDWLLQILYQLYIDHITDLMKKNYQANLEGL